MRLFKNWKKQAAEFEALLTAKSMELHRQSEALRDSFPHFQDGAPILAETIRNIGKEYHDMVMGWEPSVSQITFADANGDEHVITYESGDSSVGIPSGWSLDDYVIGTDPEIVLPVINAAKEINACVAAPNPQEPDICDAAEARATRAEAERDALLTLHSAYADLEPDAVMRHVRNSIDAQTRVISRASDAEGNG